MDQGEQIQDLLAEKGELQDKLRLVRLSFAAGWVASSFNSYNASHDN